jgi:putative transposase
MPSRNSIKIYVKDGFYHIYNRGVEKRIIFEDDQDYKVFLKYLKEALSPPPDSKLLKKTISLQGASFKGVPRQPKNFQNQIDLLAFCLMPNHFHLLLKQSSKDSMESFMRSVITRYSMYFNKRYSRVGKLFQGHYKACLIKNDNYLLHLSRYIHTNPLENYSDLTKAYSSYSQYIGLTKSNWLKPELILSFFDRADKSFFRGTNTYNNFVEKSEIDSESMLGKLILEN